MEKKVANGVLVSVIMSTYNEPKEYIKLAVDSILNQSYFNLELIVIGDSPNNEQNICLLRDYVKKDNRIKFILNDHNIGLTASLNKALQNASGSFIARMDADDISKPERLQRQLYYLINHKLDLVGSNVQDIDEDGRIRSNATVFPEGNNSIIKKARYNSPLAHPTWFGKKAVFDQMGGYHDIDACEDYDFLVRAILNGFKLGNVQETLLQYRINSLGISSTKKSRQKAALYLIRENYKKGYVTTEEEYHRFMLSELGNNKIKNLDDYYKKTAALKRMSGLKRCLYSLYVFITAKEARLMTLNLFKEKISQWL